MNKYIFGAAVTVAMSMSSSAFALTDAEIDAMLADIQSQCGTTTTLSQCDALVQAKIAELEASGTLTDTARVNALARIVETATSALGSTGGTNSDIASEISQIVDRVSTQLNTISTRSPDTAAAVNSAVTKVVVAVLVVVQEKDLDSDANALASVTGALEDIADESSDPTQTAAIDGIASTLEEGGSIVDVIEEIEVVNSFASPA